MIYDYTVRMRTGEEFKLSDMKGKGSGIIDSCRNEHTQPTYVVTDMDSSRTVLL